MKSVWILITCVAVADVWADFRYDVGVVRSNVDTDTTTINNITFFDPGVGSGLTVIPTIPSSVTKTRLDTIGVHADIYLAPVPVEVGIGPYAEAGFLSKQAKISASIQQTDRTQRIALIGGSGPFPASDSEELAFDLGFRYVLPENPVILGLQASFDETDSDASTGVFVENKSRSWLAEVGYYVSDNGAITVNYGKTYAKAKVGGIPLIGDSDSQGTRQGLAYKHVVPIFERQFLTLELATGRVEPNDDGNLKIDTDSFGLAYYPLSNLSLGYRQTRVDSGGRDDFITNYIEVGYFFDESLSAFLNIQRASDRTSLDALSGPIASVVTIDSETDGLALGLNYRY